jgi:hypothetical protein
MGKDKMKKNISLLLAIFVANSAFATVATADAEKGHKYYNKNLKECEKDGIKDGSVFTGRNDRDTWSEMKENNKIVDQWKELCPSATKKFDKMKKKDIENLADFCWQYASDGDFPTEEHK